MRAFTREGRINYKYRKWSNKRPLSNKRLVSNKRLPCGVKFVLDASLE